MNTSSSGSVPLFLPLKAVARKSTGPRPSRVVSSAVSTASDTDSVLFIEESLDEIASQFENLPNSSITKEDSYSAVNCKGLIDLTENCDQFVHTTYNTKQYRYNNNKNKLPNELYYDSCEEISSLTNICKIVSVTSVKNNSGYVSKYETPSSSCNKNLQKPSKKKSLLSTYKPIVLDDDEPLIIEDLGIRVQNNNGTYPISRKERQCLTNFSSDKDFSSVAPLDDDHEPLIIEGLGSRVQNNNATNPMSRKERQCLKKFSSDKDLSSVAPLDDDEPLIIESLGSRVQNNNATNPMSRKESECLKKISSDKDLSSVAPLDDDEPLIIEDLGIRVQNNDASTMSKKEHECLENVSSVKDLSTVEEIIIDISDDSVMDIDELLLEKKAENDSIDENIDVEEITQEKCDGKESVAENSKTMPSIIEINQNAAVFSCQSVSSSESISQVKINAVSQKRFSETLLENDSKCIKMSFKKDKYGIIGVETVTHSNKFRSKNMSRNSLSLLKKSQSSFKQLKPKSSLNLSKHVNNTKGINLLRKSKIKKIIGSQLKYLKNTKKTITKELTELEKEMRLILEERKKEVFRKASKIKGLTPFNLLDHLSEEEIIILGGEISEKMLNNMNPVEFQRFSTKNLIK